MISIGRGHNILSCEQERMLFKKYNESSNSSEKIRNKLITSNMKLVISIAKKFSSELNDIEDLIKRGEQENIQNENEKTIKIL